jgi:hypothetical protein
MSFPGFRPSSIIALALAAGSVPAFAEPSHPAPTNTGAPAPHLPSKEFAAFMKGFEGNWKCNTQFAAGALWPGSQPLAAKTTVSIRKDFDGYAWHGEFQLEETAASPATTGVFQIGYVPTTKQVTYVSYDSLGSSMMGVGRINGAQVIFNEAGYLKGVRVRVRETLAKLGPGKLFHKVEIDHGKGLHLLGEDTCTK